MRKRLFSVLTAAVLALAIPAAVMAQTTAVQARDTALAMTGGGVVVGLYQANEAGQAVHHIVIDNNVRFNVFVSVNTGDIVRVTTVQAPAAQAPAPAAPPQGAWQASPSPSPGWGGGGGGGRPTNPAVSLDRAIEIAYADLARRGLNGRFRNHSGMDWERGQWVWELVFFVQGGPLPLVEFYINVHNGAIVKFEWDD